MATKPLNGKTKLALQEHAYNHWFLDLAKVADPIEFGDLFNPSFWRHMVDQRISESDVLRILARDRSFDLQFVVAAKSPAGLMLELWPRPQPGSDAFDNLMRTAERAQAFGSATLDAELVEPASKPKQRKAAA